MMISRIILKNWRNFLAVDVGLRERVFLVGPNASGKSNFLDALRFLRDLARDGGGLQRAIGDRGGVSKIRCLAARRSPHVEMQIDIADASGKPPIWTYALGITQQPSGRRQPVLTYERVWKGERQILTRPDEKDREDEIRLTQTHLEQVNANEKFRDIAEFLQSIRYLHLVPQLLRHPEAFSGPSMPEDPFGRSFLERVARTPKTTRQSRLKKIERALGRAVPQLQELADTKDEAGVPHLEARYRHWRPQGARQREDQFSDGTLRLIGLFWSLLEGDSPLLLEEPELSLQTNVVRKLPSLMYDSLRTRKVRRQVVLSTHSVELLSDPGIGPEEILILAPPDKAAKREATEVWLASSIEMIRDLLEGGMSIGEATLPYTNPEGVDQMELF